MNRFLKLNLQRFAEPAPAQDVPAPTEGAPEPEPEKTFTQAEVDTMIKNRLSRAEKDTAKRIEDAKTEAQKLAKMSADERMEHERQERDKQLKDREQEITKRELRAEALQQLGEKGLPLILADVLPYSDADTTNAAIVAVESAFRKAVQVAVDDRLKGNAPKVGQPATPVDEVEKLTNQYNEAVKNGKTIEAVALKNKLFKLEQDKK